MSMLGISVPTTTIQSKANSSDIWSQIHMMKQVNVLQKFEHITLRIHANLT